MNYIELSIENVKKHCKELYFNIIKNYSYDLVIFIAKGSYIIGQELSLLANVPLLEIHATRKGGRLKKVLKPFLQFIPKKILVSLRKKEMQSAYHEKNENRQVSFEKEIYNLYKNAKKILLVDDSIDSGNSIIETKKALQDYFPKSEIQVAVFNVMKKSVVKPDYYLYSDTMINGPWSNDSKENPLHTSLYKAWKKSSTSLMKGINISVAMATYNGKDFIEQQIDSILSNLEENDELIISDDGSTDGTLEIIHDYVKKDKRVTLLAGPKKGVIKNFENALLHCTGDYIFLSDQDDIWLPNKKQTVMSYFAQDKDLIAVVHDAVVIDENNNIIMESWFKYRNSKNGFIRNLIKNRYLGCCMVFKRKLLEYALPIPEDIEMHDWWLGLYAELKGKTKFINEKLFQYRRHSKNVSSLNHYSIKKMIKNRWILLRRLIIRKK